MSNFNGEERRINPPLSDDEVMLLREVLESQKRWHWLATVMRNTAAWVAAVIAAILLIWQVFKDVVQKAVN